MRRKSSNSGRADLIASHFGLYSLPLLDHLRKRPFVFHFHGPWAFECEAEGGGFLATRSRWLVEKAVYRNADRFVVLSDAFANLLETRYRVARERIDIVPGGVADSFFQASASPEEARLALGLPADRPDPADGPAPVPPHGAGKPDRRHRRGPPGMSPTCFC